MEPEQDSVELHRYLAVLGRWWWALLIVPAIAGALAYFQADSQTPQYRATTEVLVQEARRSLIGPSDPTTNEELANTYARLATTSSLRGQVGQELGLTELPTIGPQGAGQYSGSPRKARTQK